jgi:hypothetical protein
MKRINFCWLGSLIITTLHLNIAAQKELRFNLDSSGKTFIKATFLNQTWVRFSEMNPATQLNGEPVHQLFDIGLRRTRMQFFGKIHDRVFFYTQLGQNNFAFNTSRKVGFFIHDALGELAISDKFLSFGAGLTGWTGLSRYASPGVGSMLCLDAPLYQQATNDINDQFLRKLSVYAKGKINRLDYRLTIAKPFTTQQASVPVAPISERSNYSPLNPKLQVDGYIMCQFKDQENNLLPYTTGSYLGKKHIFNIGGGFIFQKDALWRKNNLGDTVFQNLLLLSVDCFWDWKLNESKETAITLYSAVQKSDFGKDYFRNVAPMNPTNGVGTTNAVNGTGVGFPAIGTGWTYYTQVGYKFRKELLGEKLGTLQPYGSWEVMQINYFNKAFSAVHVGCNWLILGHQAKISVDYQLRPIIQQSNPNVFERSKFSGTFVLQYQVLI